MNQTLEEYLEKKMIAPDALAEKVGAFKKAGKTIATLNGSFDLLHAGHLEILFQASQQADLLIVALNSDASIKAYKSKSRPFIDLKNRLKLMAALEFVDYVTWFEETDPREILSIIQPNVHVNGAEYGENCIEAETVKKYGGRIQIVNLVPGLSTSLIVEKILKEGAHAPISHSKK